MSAPSAASAPVTAHHAGLWGAEPSTAVLSQGDGDSSMFPGSVWRLQWQVSPFVAYLIIITFFSKSSPCVAEARFFAECLF